MFKGFIISISVMLLYFNSLFSQKLAENEFAIWNVGVNLGTGFIMPHHPNMVLLQQGHVKSFELFVEKNTNGDEFWHQLH